MPRINPNENFEPSRSTKFWWTYTRKTSTYHSGVTLPGLFQTSQFYLDSTAFFIIIIGELYGLYNLYVIAQISFVFVVGLFLADLIFAIIGHIPQGISCRANNILALSEDRKRIGIEKKSIRRWRLLSLGAYIIIITLALFKIISFYALQGGVFDGITLAIILSYGIVAILHISSTGYFLSELLLSIMLWRERNKFYSNDEDSSFFKINGSRKSLIISEVPLENANVDKHKLYPASKSKAKESKYQYYLETWGILTDRQLESLIGHQKLRVQMQVLAGEGLRHQFVNIFQQDPIGTSVSEQD